MTDQLKSDFGGDINTTPKLTLNTLYTVNKTLKIYTSTQTDKYIECHIQCHMSKAKLIFTTQNDRSDM